MYSFGAYWMSLCKWQIKLLICCPRPWVYADFLFPDHSL